MYIFSALLIYIIFGFFLFIFHRRIVFNVTGIPQESAHYGLKNIEIIKIITCDNIELLAWFSKSKSNKPTLIYLHGNSFDIGEREHIEFSDTSMKDEEFYCLLGEDIVEIKIIQQKIIYIRMQSQP